MSKPMTVSELITELQKQPADLLVVLRLTDEWNDLFNTFITSPTITIKYDQRTYLGDKDMVRIDIIYDEP